MKTKKSILIADDDLVIAKRIAETLIPDYDTYTVTTGLEVLKKHRQNNKKYSAIILDVNFEYGMSGLEIAERIREKDKNIPILLFSAYDYSDSIDEEVKKIGVDFKPKPLDPKYIRQFIERKITNNDS